MKHRIEILQRKTIFNRSIFKVDELQLRHELYNGAMGRQITRLVLDRGDSVAVLPHDPAAGVVLLCEQFRAPTTAGGSGWLVEIPAGILEKDETVESCARRETLEEIGHKVDVLTWISTFYLSPGGSSERIHLFHGRIKFDRDISETAGVKDENEDIRILCVPVDEAFAQLHAGKIQDAKTVIALQWLRHSTTHPDTTGVISEK